MAAPTGRTPIRGYPYPLQDDDVDVSRDIQALAVTLDNEKSGGGGPTGGGALKAAPILDVGQLGQLRAGHQLEVVDFTAMGLSTPIGLWNLGDTTNKGSGGALVNKGAVPFGVGINGAAASAAVFVGSTGQIFYIADTGAADPFRIKTGSFGCWFRTAKRGALQDLIGKASASFNSYFLRVGNTNTLVVNIYDGGTGVLGVATGITEVADDRWHHVVAIIDGSRIRLYVDGAMETIGALSGIGVGSSGPLNIGGAYGDATTGTTNPHYGRIDEAFITADVLSEEQVRNLYCASVAHTLGVAPTDVRLGVRRRRRGGPLATTDFPTTPVRLHNFTAGALADQGSGGVALAPVGGGSIVSVSGVDGTRDGAQSFSGAHTGLGATDAGLPAFLTTRSYGCWFKTGTVTTQGIMGWGTISTADARITINSSGVLTSSSGADLMTGPYIIDSLWHHVVVVEDNAAGDGVKRKFYLDGRLIVGSTVMNSLTLAGANRFRVGALPDASAVTFGQIDGAFVHSIALTGEQVRVLYNKGSQELALSPKDATDHVEALEAARVLAVFDSLESSDLIDLAVAA